MRKTPSGVTDRGVSSAGGERGANLRSITLARKTRETRFTRFRPGRAEREAGSAERAIPRGEDIRGARTHERNGSDRAFRLAGLVVRRDARGRGRGRVKRVERNFHRVGYPGDGIPGAVRLFEDRIARSETQGGERRQPPPPARARRLRPRASPTPRRRICAPAAASERLSQSNKTNASGKFRRVVPGCQELISTRRRISRRSSFPMATSQNIRTFRPFPFLPTHRIRSIWHCFPARLDAIRWRFARNV